MKKTAIIIPSRLDARRLPNKPLKLINNKEMILHVYEAAKKSNAGEVYVATPDQKIIDKVKSYGGNAILTENNHQTGTDRVFEVFKKALNESAEIIINLQGDMPNIEPESIKHLVDYMGQGKCEIATLAAPLSGDDEAYNQNVVKVFTKEPLKKLTFSTATDFHRNITLGHNNFVYHHIGIYGFSNQVLINYVNFKRSKLELDRNLEQMRALENNMRIHVGLVNSKPLSVDTKEDLEKVKELMK